MQMGGVTILLLVNSWLLTHILLRCMRVDTFILNHLDKGSFSGVEGASSVLAGAIGEALVLWHRSSGEHDGRWVYSMA